MIAKTLNGTQPMSFVMLSWPDSDFLPRHNG